MLTELQRDLLCGSILGDAHVERNGPNCRVRFDHSIRQREYVRWKWGVLAPHSRRFVEYTTVDRRNGMAYRKCRFNTATASCFNVYRQSFYGSGGKCVPKDIHTLLSSPAALAVWYCDDGALRVDSRAFRLHTNSYSLGCVELLKDTLLVNYGIRCAIHQQRNAGGGEGGFILHCGSRHSQAEKFSALVKPWVTLNVPSMLYKFF